MGEDADTSLGKAKFDDLSSPQNNNIDDVKNTVQLDDVLVKLGSPGAYHTLVYGILWSLNILVAANHVSLPSSFGITPAHRCVESEKHRVSFLELHRLNVSGAELKYTQCNVWYNGTTSIPCQVWLFDVKEPLRSLVTEWDLVCDRKFVPMLLNMAYYVGVMVGGASLGHLSDKYGRRPTLMATLAASILFGFPASFAPNFYVFAVLRFLLGITMCAVQNVVYVLTPELSSRKSKTYLDISLLATFLACVVVGNIVCWLTRQWWKSILILNLPSVIPLILVYFCVPESFRWLAVRKKYARLASYLKRAAKLNRRVLPPLTHIRSGSVMQASTTAKSTYSFWELLGVPEIRRRFLTINLVWMGVAIAYYGMSFNVGSLSKNPYLSIVVASAADIAPIPILFLVVKRVGKRRILIVCFLVGGIVCVVYKFYHQIALLIVGKMLFASGFGLTLLLTTELFPTVVRNVCVGASVTLCRVGNCLAPLVVMLGAYTSPDIPVLIIGVAMVVASFVMYMVPETKSVPLPESVEEVEKYKEVKREVAKAKREKSDKLPVVVNCHVDEKNASVEKLSVQEKITPLSSSPTHENNPIVFGAYVQENNAAV